MAPIHDAVKQGDLEEVMQLVQADPGVVDSADDYTLWTALHYASDNEDVAMMSYLLDQGANINSKSKLNYTPLALACQIGCLAVVELLVSRGADPVLACAHGTPLMLAATYDHVAVVGSLVKLRAVRTTIDTQDGDHWTALKCGAYCCNAEVLKLLVEAGANPTKANSEGQTAMDFVLLYSLQSELEGQQDCIEVLQVSSPLKGIAMGVVSTTGGNGATVVAIIIIIIIHTPTHDTPLPKLLLDSLSHPSLLPP